MRMKLERPNALRNAWSLLMLSAAIVAFGGCNDPSSPLGADYLPGDVAFTTITIEPQAFSYESGVAAIANTSSLNGASVLVGRSGDSVTAHGLLSITEPYPRFETLSASEVVSVRLRMRALNYRYGDTASRAAHFDVVSIDGALRQNIQWEPTLAASIAAAAPLGSFDGAYPDTTKIEVNLDVAVATEFLRSYRVAGSSSESEVKKYLALRAAQSATSVGSWLGVDFLGAEESARPVLIVQLSDTTIEAKIDVSSWIAETPAEPAPGRMLLAGGEPVRTWLRFPIDAIPNDAIIHRAELVLHADDENSLTGTSGQANYIVAYVARDSIEARSSRTATGATTTLQGFRQTQGDVLGDEFRISSLGRVITTWLRHRSGRSSRPGDANHGLILALNRDAGSRAPLETSSLDRLSFYAPDAEQTTLRPKLTVTYSIQTDDR